MGGVEARLRVSERVATPRRDGNTPAASAAPRFRWGNRDSGPAASSTNRRRRQRTGSRQPRLPRHTVRFRPHRPPHEAPATVPASDFGHPLNRGGRSGGDEPADTGDGGSPREGFTLRPGSREASVSAASHGRRASNGSLDRALRRSSQHRPPAGSRAGFGSTGNQQRVGGTTVCVGASVHGRDRSSQQAADGSAVRTGRMSSRPFAGIGRARPLTGKEPDRCGETPRGWRSSDQSSLGVFFLLRA